MKKKNTNIYRCMATALVLMCISHAAQAHRWGVSTNVLSWANLGTINAEGAVSMSQHFTLNAGCAVNPWKSNTPTNVELMNRQYGGYIGAKYWPWHVYSEWWIGAKIQYKNFEQVGLLSSNFTKGQALGAGISAGYSFMISSHFNFDIGLGIWGGQLIEYKKYKGKTDVGTKLLEDGPKGFIFLDNVIASFVYIF